MMNVMVNIIPEINRLLDNSKGKLIINAGGVLVDNEKQQMLETKHMISKNVQTIQIKECF